MFKLDQAAIDQLIADNTRHHTRYCEDCINEGLQKIRETAEISKVLGRNILSRHTYVKIEKSDLAKLRRHFRSKGLVLMVCRQDPCYDFEHRKELTVSFRPSVSDDTGKEHVVDHKYPIIFTLTNQPYKPRKGDKCKIVESVMKTYSMVCES